MKKLLFLSAIVFIIALCGCQQSSDPPVVIIPPVTTTPTNPENPTNPGNTPTGGGDVIPNASNLVFIGQGNETVDSVEYLVKKYADVFLDDPYFYTYYKVYYLNDKVRRVYRCTHELGSARDYKYSEFNEAECKKNNTITNFYYYENGKLERNRMMTYTCSGSDSDAQGSDTYYFPSGNLKKVDSIIQGQSYMFYSFYDVNGSSPTTQTGRKLYGSNVGGSAGVFYYYYESGYLKYAYSNGYYYVYADNKTTTLSTDSTVYTTRESYTPAQALARFNELKNY